MNDFIKTVVFFSGLFAVAFVAEKTDVFNGILAVVVFIIIFSVLNVQED